MQGVKIGFALCGSFCTFHTVLPEMEALVRAGAEVQPIMSEGAYSTDTRFGTAESFNSRIEAICGRPIIHTIRDAEPIGPRKLLDILLVAPCTGNTLGKLASGIADTAVTLAVKAHLRNERPVVIGISSNDALSGNAQNIGSLLNRRHLYFVPFRQDSPHKKPRSAVADMSLIGDTLAAALEGRQLQPVLLGPAGE